MPSSKRLEETLAAVLERHVAPDNRLVLGLSGGMDSVVLLHLLRACQAQCAFQLACVHVHHGLSPHADRWVSFCEQVCHASRIPLSIHRVNINRDDPAGLEAAARAQRHQVFASIEAHFVLTAHHQNDQAETFLLQLLRGAGPKGLAGMAEVQQHPAWGATLLRPLLSIPRTEIEQYAQANTLDWVEDESNTDTAYTRNYLRQTMLPPLASRFPAAVSTLARSATLQADAAGLLEDLAQMDAKLCVGGNRLDCAKLAKLPLARAANLLRWFIDQHGLRMINQRRLDESLRQLLHAAPDAHPNIAITPGIGLRRYRGGAYLVAAHPCANQPAVQWQGEPTLRLQQAGWDVTLQPARGVGLSLARLKAAHVQLGVRQGGERIRLVKNGVHRSLKDLLQEGAFPPWQRACVPLLWCDSKLVWADKIGFDADYLASADELGIIPVVSAIDLSTDLPE